VHRLGPAALPRVHACDLDPAALDACARALDALLGPGEARAVARWRQSHAHAVDFLRDPLPFEAVDVVVGNPPYGIVDDPALRRSFPELHGEIDLYACFLLKACASVRAGGSVALLVPDSWMTNTRAEGLRRGLLDRLGLARLVDFGKPFASARDTRVHAVMLHAEAPACAVESMRGGRLEPMAPMTREQLRAGVERGWFPYRTVAEARAVERLERGASPLGDRFDVIYGLRTGGNARHVAVGPGAVPLVGGADLDAYDRGPATRHLRDPEAFAGLVRKQLGREKLGIQRIRSNSQASWRRWLEAASVGSAEVGLDSLTLVAARGDTRGAQLEGLLGVLNSSVLNRWYKLTYTDVNVKPAYVARLPVPPLEAPLADAVRLRVARPGDLAAERRVDRLVARAYDLDEESLDVLERGYWGDELARRPLPGLA
jgi:hypothetical protein